MTKRTPPPENAPDAVDPALAPAIGGIIQDGTEQAAPDPDAVPPVPDVPDPTNPEPALTSMDALLERLAAAEATIGALVSQRTANTDALEETVEPAVEAATDAIPTPDPPTEKMPWTHAIGRRRS